MTLVWISVRKNFFTYFFKRIGDKWKRTTRVIPWFLADGRMQKLLKVNTNETQSITPFEHLSRCSSYAAPCWLKRSLEWLLHGSVNWVEILFTQMDSNPTFNLDFGQFRGSQMAIVSKWCLLACTDWELQVLLARVWISVVLRGKWAVSSPGLTVSCALLMSIRYRAAGDSTE